MRWAGLRTNETSPPQQKNPFRSHQGKAGPKIAYKIESIKHQNHTA
jgi:hypothetical protein